MEIYGRGVRLVRGLKGLKGVGGKRGGIYSFSPASKRRLKWAAANAYPELITTFALTYHERKANGRELKRDLKVFNDAFNRKWGKVGKLWILEFQKRGVPHLHIWVTLNYEEPGLRKWVGDTWNRIAEPSNQFHLWWHRDRKDKDGFYNVRPWDMKSGSYLCKYLDKEHQKRVPEGFKGVGRFWGPSKGLVPDPVEIDSDAAGGEKVWITLVRSVCRHHEASLRRSPWKSRARQTMTSYRLQNGAAPARRLLKDEGEI